MLGPGGWVELQYIDYHLLNQDGSTLDDDCVFQFWERVNEGLASLGVDHTISNAGRLLQLLGETGFQQTEEKTWILPVGGWPEDEELAKAGKFMQDVLSNTAVAIAEMPLTKGLGWDKARVDEFVSSFRKALSSVTGCSHQPYFVFRSVYGQKPA